MRDVLIVGGGIIGLCAALELSRRGRDVHVLDAPGSVPPASWAGGGILSPLFPWRYPEAVTRLTRDAVARYRQLVGEINAAGGAAELDECGLLVATPEDSGAARDWAAEQGLDLADVDADLIQPGLSFERGLFLSGLGAIRNPGLLDGLRSLLSQRGVPVTEELVNGLSADAGGVSVTTERKQYLARDVLVAAGKASRQLLEGLGLSLPLVPVKGQMLLYRCEPERLRTIVLTEQGYLIPRRDGRVLAGSTLEQGNDSVMPTREAGELLHRRALALWPELRGCPLEAQWAGVRPGMKGDVPWIGPVPGYRGLWLATGHYRNGLVAAPATGELIARLINGEASEREALCYDPARDVRSLTQ